MMSRNIGPLILKYMSSPNNNFSSQYSAFLASRPIIGLLAFKMKAEQSKSVKSDIFLG